MRMTPLLLTAVLVTSCSATSRSAAPAPAGASPADAITASTTWTSSTVLRGAVTIAADSTVTLAPGAHIQAAKGASLVVAGRLLAAGGGALDGQDWAGITVARGGSVDLRGVALTGAGISTAAGAGPASLRGGSIAAAPTPFKVAAGTTLTVDGVHVTAAGVSFVTGTLQATRLTYDQGANAGMIISGAVRISDSLLLGNGKYEGDMLTTTDAREVTVRRTEVRGVHCAFHLAGVGRLALDDLDIHGNAYGFMAYGSATDVVHHITSSDVYDNRDFGLYESPGTTQGRVLVDGGYWGHNGTSAVATLSQTTGKIERTRPATSR